MPFPIGGWMPIPAGVQMDAERTLQAELETRQSKRLTKYLSMGVTWPILHLLRKALRSHTQWITSPAQFTWVQLWHLVSKPEVEIIMAFSPENSLIVYLEETWQRVQHFIQQTSPTHALVMTLKFNISSSTSDGWVPEWSLKKKEHCVTMYIVRPCTLRIVYNLPLVGAAVRISDRALSTIILSDLGMLIFSSEAPVQIPVSSYSPAHDSDYSLD